VKSCIIMEVSTCVALGQFVGRPLQIKQRALRVVNVAIKEIALCTLCHVMPGRVSESTVSMRCKQDTDQTGRPITYARMELDVD